MDKANSNSGGETREQDASLAKGNKLYEFDFDEIITDDVHTPKKEEKPSDFVTGEDETTWSKVQEEAEEKRKKKLKHKRWFKRGFKVSVTVLTWVKDIAIALLVIWVITMFAASFIKVKDDAMAPAVNKDERIVVIKFRYRFTDPARDEVIVFKDKSAAERQEESGFIGFLRKIVSSKDGDVLISRVIGLPGDKIVIDISGKITVNGVPLVTDYCDGTTTYVPGQVTYPIIVPEGCYFVLCDNPSSTGDSRFSAVGVVSKEDIVGEVFCCYWPRSAWRPIR